MNWFRSQKSVLIEQLVSQLSDSQLELALEKQKRIAAEQISASYLARAEKAEESAARADVSRENAVKALSDAQNSVTAKLLDHHISPDGPLPDPKSFTAMLGMNQKRISPARKSFKDARMRAMRPNVAPSKLEPKLNAEGKPTLGFREGMEALDLDKLIH